MKVRSFEVHKTVKTLLESSMHDKLQQRTRLLGYRIYF